MTFVRDACLKLCLFCSWQLRKRHHFWRTSQTYFGPSYFNKALVNYLLFFNFFCPIWYLLYSAVSNQVIIILFLKTYNHFTSCTYYNFPFTENYVSVQNWIELTWAQQSSICFFKSLRVLAVLFSIAIICIFFWICNVSVNYFGRRQVQVNLCQKLFFLQNRVRTCRVQKLFWMSETISVHNMFSPGLSLEFSCIELVIQWTICRHIVG